MATLEVPNSDHGVVVHQLNSLVHDHYKVLQQQNAANRRRSRDAEAQLVEKDEEIDNMRRRIEELEEQNEELSTRVTELESSGGGSLPLPGTSYISEDRRAVDIDVANCSSDPFLEAANIHGKMLVDSVRGQINYLQEMLKTSEKHDDMFRESSNHPIEFFNQEDLSWKERMETAKKELARPLAEAGFKRIQSIKEVMASYNQEGNEFQELAAHLETKFIELEQILKDFPLGDEYCHNIISKNLLVPVYNVIHAEYRNLFADTLEMYHKAQARCKVLATEREELWQQGLESMDEDLLQESTSRETDLYQLLVDKVLETNSKIRSLIGGDKCVEKALRPELERYPEIARADIAEERQVYEGCIGTYTTDKQLLKGLLDLMDAELKVETDESHRKTEKYIADMEFHRELRKKHEQDLIELFQREIKRQADCLKHSVEQEEQVRRRDLHEKSCDHVRQQINRRIDRLDTYNTVMQAGVKSLNVLENIMDIALPGLLDHILKKIDELRMQIKDFEIEYIHHHQQAYLIVYACIGKHGQRSRVHLEDQKKDELEYQRLIHLGMFTKSKEVKARMGSYSDNIHGEAQDKAKRMIYMRKIDTKEAQELYGRHGEEYPLDEAKWNLLKDEADLKALELDIIVHQEEWKQRVFGTVSGFKQISFKTNYPEKVDKIDQILANSTKPMFSTITGISQNEIDEEIDAHQRAAEEHSRRHAQDESKHDYEESEVPAGEPEIVDESLSVS